MLYIDLCMFPSLIFFGFDVLFMSLLCPFYVLSMSFSCLNSSLSCSVL